MNLFVDGQKKKVWNILMPKYYNGYNAFYDCGEYFTKCVTLSFLLKRQCRSRYLFTGFNEHRFKGVVDSVGANASALLSSFLFNYLADDFGNNVFLRKVDSRVSPSQEIEFERSLQDFIVRSPSLHECLVSAISDAVDFGAGFISTIDGNLRALSHLDVGVSIGLNSGRPLYIIDGYGTDCYWVICKRNDISPSDHFGVLYLNYLNNMPHYLYEELFLHDSNMDNKEQNYYLFCIKSRSQERTASGEFIAEGEYIDNMKYYGDCPIHDLRFPFYNKNGGCGFVAYDALDRLSKLMCLNIKAEEHDISPAMSYPSTLIDDTDKKNHGIMPDTTYVVDSTTENPSPIVLSPSRSVVSAQILQIWRNYVNESYFVPSINNAGYESPFVMCAGHGFYNNFAYQLIFALLRTKEGKKLIKEKGTSRKIEETGIRFSGSYQALVLKRKTSVVNSLLESIANLAKLNPEVLDVIDVDGILRRVSESTIPEDFLRSAEDVERIRISRAMAQVNQNNNNSQ